MALPKIVQAGSPVLRRPAALVSPDRFGTRELKGLVATMIEVMRAAPGVGLAAPQIGVGLKVLVLEDKEELMARLSPEDRALRGRTPFPVTAICNPELTKIGDGRATFFEGCLSVGGYMALVERDLEVEVTGTSELGEPVRIRTSGWPARILQHEVDHLNGTLYVDRMLTRSFCANEEAIHWIGKPVSQVREALDV
jgi:peptide deformylase